MRLRLIHKTEGRKASPHFEAGWWVKDRFSEIILTEGGMRHAEDAGQKRHWSIQNPFRDTNEFGFLNLKVGIFINTKISATSGVLQAGPAIKAVYHIAPKAQASSSQLTAWQELAGRAEFRMLWPRSQSTWRTSVQADWKQRTWLLHCSPLGHGGKVGQKYVCSILPAGVHTYGGSQSQHHDTHL